MLDIIHYLGGDVKRVYAMSWRVSELLDVDDVTTILFELESGAGAYLATLMAVPNVTTVAALGTEGAAWSEADGAHAFIQKRGEPYRTEVPVTTSTPSTMRSWSSRTACELVMSPRPEPRKGSR